MSLQRWLGISRFVSGSVYPLTKAQGRWRIQAVAPQVYEGAVFQASFAALIGAVAGSFAGRAVQVWRGSVYNGTL